MVLRVLNVTADLVIGNWHKNHISCDTSRFFSHLQEAEWNQNLFSLGIRYARSVAEHTKFTVAIVVWLVEPYAY